MAVAESSDANIPILMSNQSSTADEDEEDIVEQRNPLAGLVDIDEIGTIVEKRKTFAGSPVKIDEISIVEKRKPLGGPVEDINEISIVEKRK